MTASLLLALALSGSAAMPAPKPSPSAAATPGQAAERIELACSFPPWAFTGTFRLAAGGVGDAGAARDEGALLGPNPRVVRVLQGARGTLTLVLRGEARAGFPSVVGRWTIESGTGAYAGWRGGGTFASSDSGGGQPGGPLGSTFERQTLLGRVTRR